ncbi:MAG TPA: hypothetical protein VHR66_12415 [Gemmataceae bacterium]|nr:hypothetical protein [Gemmataceae bacterium]
MNDVTGFIVLTCVNASVAVVVVVTKLVSFEARDDLSPGNELDSRRSKWFEKHSGVL